MSKQQNEKEKKKSAMKTSGAKYESKKTYHN